MSQTSPYDLNENGSAKDPLAFQAALRQDEQRMAALQAEPEVAAIVTGDDIAAFQTLLKRAFQNEKHRVERENKRLAERTIDAQRASAPVPRDTVQIYQQLYDSGLQYGPAFRLLRNVHVPDLTAA